MRNPKKKVEINLKNELEGRVNFSTIHIHEPERIDETFDIRVTGVNYRVFINKTLNRVWCNEIISYNYKGMVLLKNPALDLKLSKLLQEIVKNSNTPRVEWLNTMNHAREALRKEIKNQLSKRRLWRSRRGRRKEPYLIKATLWAIRNRKPGESKTDVARRAFPLFEKEATSKDAFVQSVVKKWTNVQKIWREETSKLKIEDRPAFKKDAKRYLKV